MDRQVTRRRFLAGLGSGTTVLAATVSGCGGDISDGTLQDAERIAGVQYTPEERALMLEDVQDRAVMYAKRQSTPLDPSVEPALFFHPDLPVPAPATSRQPGITGPLPVVDAPLDIESCAFYTIPQLASLLRSRQITSVDLTRMYLDRLRRYDPQLHCVITLTDDLALAQAERADREIAAGRYRSLVQGIPWGAKDLFAVKDLPTTWGAAPYRDQVFDYDATIVERLTAAGAVLVAKLSMGALAWGDVWFGEKTRTPWDTTQGSSGSSAGPGAATAAGLVGFAIGTETHGSIVSPCHVNGLSGLRPTFGRVSRHGAMPLSWSLDKIGPMCRSVEDCAIVFDLIYGPDGKDGSVSDAPFHPRPVADLSALRVGYLPDAFAETEDREGVARDDATLAQLRAMSIDLIPLTLPDYPRNVLRLILESEGAAVFQELTDSGRDDLLVRQIANAWPNVFRRARLIPAVEYIQANRMRTQLMADYRVLFAQVDVYVAPTWNEDSLAYTNYTGHPCTIVPNGLNDKGLPNTISFVGGLYREADVVLVAQAYQEATDFHRQYPPDFAV